MDNSVNIKHLTYPYGFVNFTGAACWLNSMIQAVLGCSTINQIAVEDKETKLAEMYSIIIKKYENPDNNEIFRLQQIMTNLSDNKEVTQNVNNQNDPTEFIQLFIEGLGKKILDKCVHTVKSTISCSRDGIVDHQHIKRDNGVLVPIALNHMSDITRYLKSHTEELEYRCDKFQQTSDKIRLLQLSHASEILIIMVKNYLYTGSQSNVKYPRELHFNKSNDGGKWVYTVMSVVEHHGIKDVRQLIASKGGGGHYTCTSRRKNINGGVGIYNLNDSSVTQVNDFPDSPNVCIIVYSRHSVDD